MAHSTPYSSCGPVRNGDRGNIGSGNGGANNGGDGKNKFYFLSMLIECSLVLFFINNYYLK
jgi:hypothetical protein